MTDVLAICERVDPDGYEASFWWYLADSISWGDLSTEEVLALGRP